MTIAEIKNNPNLLIYMTEDLDDFADDTEVVFEGYIFSYDPEWNLLDSSICLVNSSDPVEAIELAKKISLEDEDLCVGLPARTYLVLEVESVVSAPEGGFLNLGTIYTKNFF